jgi:hypothetical protein
MKIFFGKQEDWHPGVTDLPPKPKKGAFAEALKKSKDKLANKDARDAGFAGSVANSPEFARIMQVPRRILDLDEVTDLTSIFRKDGGTMDLRPIQSAALIDAHTANGFLGPIGVGHGKTLISLLLPEAMDSERTVLLVPPQLRDQLTREIVEVYGPHFNLPLERIVQVVAYSELSLAKNAELLDALDPDLIVADECHNLKRAQSARTKRFLRYMRENPHCRFCGMSGTMTNRSIKDYAHLLELALRKNSPLPNSYKELCDWSGALDVKPAKLMLPGVLKELCNEKENVRQGYRGRLIETLGVVATEESALGTSILVRNIKPDAVPASIEAAIAEVKRYWSYNGEEFSDPLAFWRFQRQISCGFYYRWVWPDGKPDEEWLEARSAWKKAARDKIKLGRKGMDSEFLVASAAERWRQKTQEDKEFKPGTTFFACEEWLAWREVKGRYKPTPPTEAVWLSDFVAVDAIKRAKKLVKAGRKVIIWYSHKIIGNRLGDLSGFSHYGSGTDASATTEDVIICSIATQGTGKNLQHYNHNIIVTMPTNGKDFEQLAGRTHRPGQLEDSVIIDYYDHTESLDKHMSDVIADALYIQDSTGQRQKILYADGEKIKHKQQTILDAQVEEQAETELQLRIEYKKQENKGRE